MKFYRAQSNGDIHPIEAMGLYIPQVTTDEDLTIESVESILSVNVDVDGGVVTLPKITADNLGMRILVRNIGADGAYLVSVSPDAVDGINGTISNAAADSVASGVVDKDLSNTKSTANKGDYVILEAVAETEWYIVGGVGIWASEA
jgi:hypothetical protein